MNLKIQLNYDQVGALDGLLSKIYDVDFINLEREIKSAISIGYELADTFNVKYKNLHKKGLLALNKKVQITLPYYKMEALQNICIHLIGWTNENSKFQIQQVINKINPLL